MNKTWRKDRARLVDATSSSYRDSRALGTSWGQHHLVFWEKGVPSHSWDFWLFSGTRWEERTASCCTHGAPNSLGLPPSHRLWIFSGERKRPLRRPIVVSQKKTQAFRVWGLHWPLPLPPPDHRRGGWLIWAWNETLAPPLLHTNRTFSQPFWFHSALKVRSRSFHLSEPQLFVWEKVIMAPQAYCEHLTAGQTPNGDWHGTGM